MKSGMLVGLVVAAIVVVGLVGYTMMSIDDGNNSEDGAKTITVNGAEIEFSEDAGLVSKSYTDDGKTYDGYLLSSFVEESGLEDPGSYDYVLKADDGYAAAVSWTSMQTGILAEVEDEGDDGQPVTYLMTYFPDLPSGYKVRHLANIEPAELTGFTVDGFEYYIEYMPKRVNKATIIANNTDYTGYSLSDMVNYTGLENPDSYNYTIIASDGYSKTVNWTSMMSGVIASDEMRAVFPGLQKSFWVSDIVSITIE